MRTDLYPHFLGLLLGFWGVNVIAAILNMFCWLVLISPKVSVFTSWCCSTLPQCPPPKEIRPFIYKDLWRKKRVKHYRFWSLLKGLISFWGVGIGPNNVLGHIAATRSRWIFYHYWIRPPNGKELDISTGLWTNSFWTYTVAQYKRHVFLLWFAVVALPIHHVSSSHEHDIFNYLHL